MFYESDRLMMAIYDNTLFTDDIAIILFEYASGALIKCGNYVHCKEEICFTSWLDAEKYGNYVTKKLCKDCMEGPASNSAQPAQSNEHILKCKDKETQTERIKPVKKPNAVVDTVVVNN